MCQFFHSNFLLNGTEIKHYLVYLHRNKIFNQVQHFIHFNLCLALLLGLIAFVSGIEAASEHRVNLLTYSVLYLNLVPNVRVAV